MKTTEKREGAASTGQFRLSDRQLVVLSAAARREDRAIEVPETLKGRAREAFGQGLLRRGLAIESMALVGQPVWRQDEAGCRIALVATAEALAALCIEEEPPELLTPLIEEGQPATAAIPRAGSKQAQLVALLSREEGCSVDEAAQTLGWLPHTTRAALTGLRQKGHVIERWKAEEGRGSRHRIVRMAAQAAA